MKKFVGSDVRLQSQQGGMTIGLEDKGVRVAEINLTEHESMQLLSFCLTAFGLENMFELVYVDDEDDPSERTLN